MKAIQRVCSLLSSIFLTTDFSSVLLEALVVIGDGQVERGVLELFVVERVPSEAEDLGDLPLHRVVRPVEIVA